MKHKVASREAASVEGQGHLGSCLARRGSSVLSDRLEGLSKLGGAHRRGGQLMTQFQTQVPHPVTDPLPGAPFRTGRDDTSGRGRGYWSSSARAGSKAPRYRRERDDLGGRERLLRQVREDQLVDDAVSGEADATLLRGLRMSRHSDAKAEPCWSHRHVKAVGERAHPPAFRACERLIGGSWRRACPSARASTR